MRFQIAAGRGNFQPIGILFQGSKKIGQPSVRVAVLVGARPNTKLFHVVAHGGNAARVSTGGVPKISDDVFDFAKRDQIAQRFLPRVKPHGLAAVFGDIDAEEFFRLEAGGEEMHVVDKGVSDVRGGKSGGKLRLPYALSKPCAGWSPAKVFLEISGQARNLFTLIFGRNRDEDRLVEAATDEFHLAGLDQFFEANEILWPVCLNPGKQRPGIVEAEANLRMLFEVLDERKIGGVVGLFEYVLEIATGLVRVNEQSEMKFRRHGDSFFSLTS